MNKQAKANGGRGIEWTDYTSNPIGGCMHACQWQMPDGSIANCYAEDVANRVAQRVYPHGFEHHYWRPAEFKQWKRLKPGDKVFVGSMADVFGAWVPQGQIEYVLDEIAQYPGVIFQMLTKNPKRALKFDLPRNVWLGCSTPPDFMWNKRLTWDQRRRMFEASLGVLAQLKARGATTWISAEPLSWDVSRVLDGDAGWMGDPFQCPPFDWIVIGAASNGKTYYAPEETHVRRLIGYCDAYGVAVFMKGNLRALPWSMTHWREDFPEVRHA